MGSEEDERTRRLWRWLQERAEDVDREAGRTARLSLQLEEEVVRDEMLAQFRDLRHVAFELRRAADSLLR